MKFLDRVRLILFYAQVRRVIKKNRKVFDEIAEGEKEAVSEKLEKFPNWHEIDIELPEGYILRTQKWRLKTRETLEKRIKFLKRLNKEKPQDGFTNMRIQNIAIYKWFLESLKSE